MAELKNPACSNTSCPMVLHETCTVGKNEAGSNYEVFSNTAAAKNARNAFLDNSMAPVFDKPTPKLLAVVTDKFDTNQIFLGSTVRVDAIFSHEVEYKKGKLEIKVSVPENVEFVNSMILVDRHTIRNTIKLIKTGIVSVVGTYTDENGVKSTGSVTLTVINPEDYVPPSPEVIKVVSNKTTVEKGESIIVQVRTNKPLEDASNVTITVDDKLTKDGAAVLLDDKETVKQVLKAAKKGNSEINIKTVGGLYTKKIKVKVTEAEQVPVDPIITSITASPNSVAIGADTTVTIAFDKAPNLSDVTITPDLAKLTQKVAPAVSGNNVTVTYTGKAAGAAAVSAKYKEGVAKNTTINVTAGV